MPSKSPYRQVRQAYHQDELARICMLPESEFGRAFGMQTVSVERPADYHRFRGDDPEDYYHFRDNGGRVLAVAHLDTVVSPKGRAPRFASTQAGPLVVSGALDDRLGTYVILRLLPALGVTCDWLLTVGEESAQSTAQFFEPGKDYDWVIEFDRGGTDVVMYQYEDDASSRLVRASGAPVGSGSFSDIAYLEHLGVKAFNWGVGYRGNYHSERGYAYLGDTFAMVAKYLQFHAQNAGTAMPHVPEADRGHYDAYAKCFICGTYEAVDPVTRYCLACGACADCELPECDCQCWQPGGTLGATAPASSTHERERI